MLLGAKARVWGGGGGGGGGGERTSDTKLRVTESFIRIIRQKGIWKK